MKFEFFIVKRFIKAKQSKFSRPIIVVAIASIALGIAVMLLSVFVLSGFKTGIREKVSGFGGHIQVIPYNISNTYLSNPITLSTEEKKNILKNQNVKSISPFVTKGGAIKTKTDFAGILLKGIDKTYGNMAFFSQYLIEGLIPNLESQTNEVLISQDVCNKMNLKIGDKIRIFFYIDQQYRQRAFIISGIYETGLGIYDEKMVICDMRVLQTLNQWKENQYQGYEIMLRNFNLLSQTADSIYQLLENDKTIQTIEEAEPSLFAWLSLLDSNVLVILIVMLLVSIAVMTSSLLIMIFEKRQTIGLLKSLGASLQQIIKIFMLNALYVIVKGLIYGNIVAFGLALLQKKYMIFTLNSQSYYLQYVPIELNLLWILLINCMAIVICTLALLIPSRNIAKISPATTIKSD
jgi:lipoprotein-releasing system permease protein